MNKLKSIIMAIAIIAGPVFAMEIIEYPQHAAIVLWGEVVEEDIAMMESYFMLHPELENVSLHSGGGVGYVGEVIGQMIRDNELNTIVQAGNRCYSACALMFLGGVMRVMQQGNDFADAGELGYHASAIPEGTEITMDEQAYLEQGQFIGYSRSVYYIEMLGAKAAKSTLRYLAWVIARKDPLEIHVPTVAEMVLMGVTNNLWEAPRKPLKKAVSKGSFQEEL